VVFDAIDNDPWRWDDVATWVGESESPRRLVCGNLFIYCCYSLWHIEMLNELDTILSTMRGLVVTLRSPEVWLRILAKPSQVGGQHRDRSRFFEVRTEGERKSGSHDDRAYFCLSYFVRKKRGNNNHGQRSEKVLSSLCRDNNTKNGEKRNAAEDCSPPIGERGRTIAPAVSRNPTEGNYLKTVRGCTLRCHERYKPKKNSASLV
jgi:hypothetical protein